MPFSILLIRLSSLGDVLLASPLARELRRAYSGATGERLRLDVCTGETESEIYRYNPHCDAVYAYKRSWSQADVKAWKRDILSELASNADAEQYDLVLDLQGNARSRRIRVGLGARFGLVSKPRLRTLALLAFGEKSRSLCALPHVVERYRAATKGAAKDDGEGLEFWLPEERDGDVYPPLARIPPTPSVIADKRLVRIGIAPGAKHATKRWLPEYFAEAAALAGERIARATGCAVEFVALGGTDDAELCAEIRNALCERAAQPVAVSVTNSLTETARLFDRCDALLCNDSFALHLAAARRTPVVAVFGSTTPEFGFAPYQTPHAVAEIQLSCRPCTHLGRERCPKGHFKCMRLLRPETVATRLFSMLGF